MTAETLELKQDESFQKREWLVQHIGWILWSGIILAALMGLLGSGPLSNESVAAADGSIRVEYQRFVHHHHVTTITLQVLQDVSTEKAVRIEISEELLKATELRNVQPEPQEKLLSDRGAILVFPLDQAKRCPMITFHLEYEDYGRSGGTVSLQGHAPVPVRPLIYP
jgi:hypothetical protein